MISLQSVAVASAATSMGGGEESRLFRFTLRHSILLAVVIGLIAMFYAYVAPALGAVALLCGACRSWRNRSSSAAAILRAFRRLVSNREMRRLDARVALHPRFQAALQHAAHQQRPFHRIRRDSRSKTSPRSYASDKPNRSHSAPASEGTASTESCGGPFTLRRN